MTHRQKTATIQDEDGHYRAAKVGDTFCDPDGNWMMAVPMETTDEEGSHSQREVFGLPTTIQEESRYGQVQVH